MTRKERALRMSIVESIAFEHNLAAGVLIAPPRYKRQRCADISRARDEAAYVIRALYGDSYPQLGRFFGGRDHSTMLAACQRHLQRSKEAEGAHEPA